VPASKARSRPLKWSSWCAYGADQEPEDTLAGSDQ
jgi:hypothetical protein